MLRGASCVPGIRTYKKNQFLRRISFRRKGWQVDTCDRLEYSAHRDEVRFPTDHPLSNKASQLDAVASGSFQFAAAGFR
jgi:hypothetical protein